jgi:hypothetical protein
VLCCALCCALCCVQGLFPRPRLCFPNPRGLRLSRNIDGPGNAANDALSNWEREMLREMPHERWIPVHDWFVSCWECVQMGACVPAPDPNNRYACRAAVGALLFIAAMRAWNVF